MLPPFCKGSRRGEHRIYHCELAKLLEEQRALAIEPIKNLSRNGVTGEVILFPGVASDCEGTLERKFIAGKEKYSSLGAIAHSSVAGEREETLQAPAATLDSLTARYSLDPGFLKKSNVEGWNFS